MSEIKKGSSSSLSEKPQILWSPEIEIHLVQFKPDIYIGYLRDKPDIYLGY